MSMKDMRAYGERPRSGSGAVNLVIDQHPVLRHPIATLHAPTTMIRRLLPLVFSMNASLFAEESATPVERIKIAQDFKVELLYTVPKAEQGSWVSMCLDDKGRLITSDQYGALYRITPPALGGGTAETGIEKINLPIGAAQGMAFVKGSIYLQVNGDEYQGRGLYRISDTNGDDAFDQVDLLRGYTERAGEHGPHDVVPGPDGDSVYVIVGNQTPLTEFTKKRVPAVWQEDLLLPRVYGRGFMKDALAPRGWVAKVSLDGKEWELITTGFRNQYGAAFNREGDLFTFDADMEWDMSLPWYRPTRVCQVLSGSEFGWRNGSGKWPVRWEDSVPPVVDIGPGSPTGTQFGYGAKFPAKYQEAYFICDWSYGKMYAVHLRANGAGYTADFEEFMSAQPMPFTDLVINPKDGAMYVSIGGRKTQSALYRVTYVGSESTEPKPFRLEGESKSLYDLRRSLEAFHGRQNPAAVEAAWVHLEHPDRLIRNAARIAIEHQPVATWKAKALSEKQPRKALTALMALIRNTTAVDQPAVITALDQIALDGLDLLGQTTLLRNYTLAFLRLGEPSPEQKKRTIARFAPLFPQQDVGLNQDLCEMLVYLGDEAVIAKAVPLVNHAPTQEEQIGYAKSLRLAKAGWTPALREQFFKWFSRAATYTGGASFGMFIEDIKRDSLASLSDSEKAALKPILDAPPAAKTPSFAAKPLAFVKQWTVKDLEGVLNVGLEGGRNFENGRNSFGAIGCFACHRFNFEGGAVGPDLTSVSGKFGPRDLLESIIEPSKEISDQYGSMDFKMKDGSLVIGRIMNLKEDTLMVNVNMLDPNAIQNLKRADIESINPSKISMMPAGLVNMLKEDDILDLLAYLLSKGDPKHPFFSTK
jgi:putative heme-binding domain-containing protein